MPFNRTGFVESLTDSRLSWFTGTAYSAAPASLYIGLYSGLPLSDGSGGNEIVRVGPVAFGAPQTLPGGPAWPTTRFIQPTAAVSVNPGGVAAPGAHFDFTGYGIFSQASGGTPVYTGSWAGELLAGVATTLTAQTFRIFAEQPS